jgi:arylsulfatase A-like enzyme
LGSRHLFVVIAAGAALASCQSLPAPDAHAGLAPASRPNILMIVADDLGYLDLGVYGSEIRTPNIDALAAGGLILTNYYTAPMCAPTRAMLLSGMDNHMAGVGTQIGQLRGAAPGYEGYLNERVAPIATRLHDAGYMTAMAGKWHLGSADNLIPAARGFDRSFALLDGGASHWGDMRGLGPGPAHYRDDAETVESLPDDFYSTIYYTDRMIEYVDQSVAEDKPFFGYLAYTSPHWPIQALDEDIAKTRGMYDEGWDVLRERRFEAWKALGYGPADAELPRDPADYVAWDTLSDEEKAKQARIMEVYAAMVERMDAEIGRLLAHLDAIGERDDTLIIFVADNGAEGFKGGDVQDDYDNSLDNIGRPNSYTLIGPSWAEAATAPYWLRKWYPSEGGIHVPAIVNGPALGVPVGRNDSQIVVKDLAPTFLELAGAPEDFVGANGETYLPITGVSIAPILRGETTAVRTAQDDVGWELDGHRALRRGDWKVTWIRPPHGPDHWELFNLATDPAERHDLSADEPAIFAELTAAWDDYAEANGVIVVEDE